MNCDNVNVIDNLIQAVSILNKTEEYLESLTSRLSECDSLISDYQHFIENANVEEVDLKELYLKMQEVFQSRRLIKNDIALSDNYKNLSSRLNNSTNREFLLQSMKNAKTKLGTTYKNRILKEDDINILLEKSKKKVGRPRKLKEGV